jgi:hypothetical protein
MNKQTGSEASVSDPSEQKVQRSGNPGKAPLHEGGAGKAASEGKTKWQGPVGGRDPVGEKEPGKSRGPGG